jgi:hypothetical protein
MKRRSCSFCSASETEVVVLVAGPKVGRRAIPYICGQCARVCIDIVFERYGLDPPSWHPAPESAPRPPEPSE